MKISHFFAFLIGWLSLFNMAQGQSTTRYYSFRQYVVKVRLVSHKEVERGILHEVTDSTIVLAPVRQLKPTLRRILDQHGGTLPSTDSLRRILPLRTYRYTDINRLSIHRRGAFVKGFLVGTVVGAMTFGAATVKLANDMTEFVTFGLAQTQPMSTGAAISLATGTGALVGGLPGFLAGAALTTKTIRVNQQVVSAEAHYRLRERSLVEQINRATLYAR